MILQEPVTSLNNPQLESHQLDNELAPHNPNNVVRRDSGKRALRKFGTGGCSAKPRIIRVDRAGSNISNLANDILMIDGFQSGTTEWLHNHETKMKILDLDSSLSGSLPGSLHGHYPYLLISSNVSGYLRGVVKDRL